MSTMGILLSAIVMIAGLFGVFHPLFQQQAALGKQAKAQRERDELLVMYERIVATVRDLDEDFRTGKIATDDYHRDRATWSERGVEVLQALEKIGGKSIKQNLTVTSVEVDLVNTETIDQDLDDVIEAAISQYVAKADKKRPALATN